MKNVKNAKPSSAPGFDAVFGRGRLLVGVVHLLPLPGAPRHRDPLSAITKRALADTGAYFQNGADAVIVENFGDAPFHRDAVEPHVVAAMAVIAAELKAASGGRPVGVNVLRNAAEAALGIAVGAGLDFLRVNVLSGAAVTDQGVIEGAAARLLRERRRLDSECRIFADLRVKHATPLGAAQDVEVEVEELRDRALVDAILVTGRTTGRAPDPSWLESVAAAAGSAPILVASGASAENVGEFSAARGFIVGSSLKRGGDVGRAVDPARVARFRSAMDAR